MSGVKSSICKFRCTQVHNELHGNQTVTLNAQYDESLDEDRRFSKYTPNGRMEFTVANPALEGFYEEGEVYLITLEKQPKA